MNDAFDPQQAAGEVSALFKKAESRIKILELLDGDGLNFPPVNQLRYVGFHMLKALNEDGNQEDWKRAKRHCQRAIYDASEMALVYCIEEVHGFQEDYGKVDIVPTIGDYLEIVKISREAQELLATTNHEERENKYTECDQLFEVLKPLVDRLNDARPELNKRLTFQRKTFFYLAVAVILGIITIIINLI